MSYQFRLNMPNNIVFGNNIGTLSFDDEKLSFTGNADESAKILFDFVVAQLNGHIQKLIIDEREMCAKLLDDFSKTEMVPVKNTWRMGLVAGANAIRARGEK